MGRGAEVFVMLMFASICVDVFPGVCVCSYLCGRFVNPQLNDGISGTDGAGCVCRQLIGIIICRLTLLSCTCVNPGVCRAVAPFLTHRPAFVASVCLPTGCA